MQSLRTPCPQPLPTEGIDRIENAFERLQRGRMPRFWYDPEVRRAAIGLYRRATIDQAAAQLARLFPAGRSPSRSALARFWQSIDSIREADKL